MAEAIDRAAVVGCGVSGAAWAAPMRLRGVDIAVYDPAVDVAETLDKVMAMTLRHI